MGPDDITFPQTLLRHRGEAEERFVQAVMGNFHILPPDPLADTHPQSLDKGLLGGEAGGVVLSAGFPGTAVIPFRRGEEAIEERLVLLINEPLEARHLHDVHSGPDYQRRER